MLRAIREMMILTTKPTVSAVALVYVVGCSSASSNRNYRREELNEESQRIAAAEQHCIEAATKRANDDLSKLEMTKNRKDGQQMLALNQRRSQELSQCEAEAGHENEELSARQQVEYERETEEEKAHATMISVIASQPRWH